jgi:hypothetical protein
MEECKIKSPTEIEKALELSKKPIIKDDGSDVTTIDRMVNLIVEKKEVIKKVVK